MSEKFKIFFIMPFDPSFNDLYSHLKDVIENENELFEVFRADNLLHQQNILKDIVLSIYESDLIIADLSDLNANVFYELGLAHALRKDVVLLTQQIDEVPFDLRSYRVISYSTNFKKIQELEASFKKLLKDIKEGQLLFGSPVTDWLPESKLNKEGFVFPSSEVHSINIEKEIQEEGGVWDYITNLEESMANLHDIITDFGDTTEHMGNAMTDQAKEIEVLAATQGNGSGSASRIRKLVRKASTILNDFGLSVVEYNKAYEKNWTSFEENINNLFNSDIMKKEIEEDPAEFETFLNILSKFKNDISPAKEGLELFLTTISSLRGMESSLNKAVILVEGELQGFINLLDTSVATTDRLCLKGSDILEKGQK